MSRVQLYVKNTADETLLLELSDDSPVKMIMSVSELNPFTPSSFYTRTFRIPGVGPNIQFFQDVYSVNGSSFDPSISSPAWILNDGFLFSVGNLNLQNVFTNDRTGNVEYEVYFLGDTSDLASSIGQGGMNLIPTADLDHEVTYANVTSSWDAVAGTTGGLKDGNVVYPLCDWGYTYGETGGFATAPIQNTLSVGFPKSFTLGATGGIRMQQMKPAVKVKWLWDKIFADAGYNYTSTFLDSELFDNLYILNDTIARPQFSLPVGECTITAPIFSVGLGQTIKIPFNIAISDPSQVFDLENNVWVCPASGTYTIYSTGLCKIGGGTFKFPQAAIIPKLYVNTTQVNPNFTYYTSTGLSPFQVTWSVGATYAFTEGDEAYVNMEQLSNGNRFAQFENTQFVCSNSPADIINLASLLPTETQMKKIDFIKSITKMFNLVFEPSRIEQKVLLIEPWIDWIQLGGLKDWTKYYDGSVDVQSSPVFLGQSRIVKWKSAQDEDFQNKAYQEQYKQDYSFRQFDSGIKLLKGEQDIEIQFGSTPLESIPSKTTSYPDWVLPVLARIQPGDPQEQKAGKVEPIQPKPRILFYNGKQSNPVDWYLFNDNGGGTGQPQPQYPLMSPYSSWPPDVFSTLNLSFQSKDALWSNSSTYEGLVSKDLYTEYWSEFNNWVYDPFNRKVNLTMRLDPLDVQELRFNDRVWIKDTWYFVNKVTDYPVGETALVKLELVKVPLAAIPGPIPVAATGATAGTTCRQVALCFEAGLTPESYSTYTYVDCNVNLASVTLTPETCATPVCMLFPLINPLPPNWSAADNGPCGSTGVDFNFDVGITGLGESTTITISTSPGTTAGPYTPINIYTYAGDQTASLLNIIPDNSGLRVELTTALATGAAITTGSLELLENGSVVVTDSISGTYRKLSVQYPSVINVLNTYGGTASFNY